jgi:gamma-glutamyl-gamma-aminobutyraldehyde dehydrogenase
MTTTSEQQPPTFRTQAFIDGDFCDAASGARFVSLNPATGTTLAEVTSCGKADVDRAVGAARRAFEDGRWSRQTPEQRKGTLLRFAELLEENAEEIARLDTLDAGKPITDCRTIDVPETVKCFRWYAEAADKLFCSVAPTGPGHLGLIVREPVGVVAAVLPWNFPALMFAWKVAPALAVGNSVVVKPSKLTSLSAIRMTELAAQAGVPAGVLNIVPGSGEDVGQALGRHQDVDAVSVTGSTEVGRLFLAYSSESNLKKVVLELGGKNPQIVLADAPDLEIVAQDVLSAGYWNMGENCSAGSRLLVHQSIKDELLASVVKHAAEWTVGDPLGPGTKIGPLVEERHMQKVLGYIGTGRDEGADVVIGGGRVLEETGGYFVAPTIFDNVGRDMRVAREEIFGPVICVIAFQDEQEAVELANGTNYGLTASLWTKSLDSAVRVSRAVRAGTVSVNCFSGGDITTPFGGYKESGFGGRDNGLEAFDQYTEVKTIWMTIR